MSARTNERDRFYASGYWRRVRQIIRERDGHACTQCGSTTRLSVDHINGDFLDNRYDNLRTLCLPCHGRKDGPKGRGGAYGHAGRPPHPPDGIPLPVARTSPPVLPFAGPWSREW